MRCFCGTIEKMRASLERTFGDGWDHSPNACAGRCLCGRVNITLPAGTRVRFEMGDPCDLALHERDACLDPSRRPRHPA